MRPAKREPHKWAELVRKLQEFEQSELHRELVKYLEYLRDQETGFLDKPSVQEVTLYDDAKLRSCLALRYAYNRAILAVDGLTKYAASRAKADSQESE